MEQAKQTPATTAAVKLGRQESNLNGGCRYYYSSLVLNRSSLDKDELEPDVSVVVVEAERREQ
jgi:hypothetical protein